MAQEAGLRHFRKAELLGRRSGSGRSPWQPAGPDPVAWFPAAVSLTAPAQRLCGDRAVPRPRHSSPAGTAATAAREAVPAVAVTRRPGAAQTRGPSWQRKEQRSDRYTRCPAQASSGAAAFVLQQVVSSHPRAALSLAARTPAGASRQVWAAQVCASCKAWAGPAYASCKAWEGPERSSLKAWAGPACSCCRPE